MKNSIFLLLMLWALYCNAQQTYWQQKVDVTIDVALNDKENSLTGFEKIIYYNNAPDTLHYIWFHLWPNAYKNDKTAFSNQLLQLGNTRFYFSSREERGYINRLDFKVDGITSKWEEHPEHIDIIKLVLPKPLAPGTHITITTPFHVKLPYLFSRGGYSKGTYQVTQWYPKPAVYDAKGWHPMPYLEQGEFYSDFGDYDVTITVPAPYVVAATGQLQNKEEMGWMETKKSSPTYTKKTTSHTYGRIKKRQSIQKSNQVSSSAKIDIPEKVLRFSQQNIHDFAWIANKNYQVNHDTCQLASGKIIDVFCYYTGKSSAWTKSLLFTKEALRFYSVEVGDYPYAVMHVAESDMPYSGGMEYPTLTIISPQQFEKSLDGLIAHEVGHNWFYGALAANERESPWLDEGLNTFYEQKYQSQKYGRTEPWENLLLETLIKQKKDQPIITTAAHLYHHRWHN